MNIIEGDVIVELKSLEEKTFDCIITSPPYNIGIDYGEKVNDKKLRKDYLQWILDVFTECKRVLTDNGSLFINIGYTNIDPWIHMDVAQQLRSIFVLQNNFTWVKNISIDDTSHGHFKPINSKRFVNVTNENVYHFTKTGNVEVFRKSIGVPYMYKSNLSERNKKVNKTGEVKEDKRCRGNSWFIPYKTIQSKEERGKHPASYPDELVKRCLKLSGATNVLDPFLGSGTTLTAAKDIGIVRGTGIEINPNFVEFARKRVFVESVNGPITTIP